MPRNRATTGGGIFRGWPRGELQRAPALELGDPFCRMSPTGSHMRSERCLTRFALKAPIEFNLWEPRKIFFWFRDGHLGRGRLHRDRVSRAPGHRRRAADSALGLGRRGGRGGRRPVERLYGDGRSVPFSRSARGTRHPRPRGRLAERPHDWTGRGFWSALTRAPSFAGIESSVSHGDWRAAPRALEKFSTDPPHGGGIVRIDAAVAAELRHDGR